MYDLIYDSAAKFEIHGKFPTAKFSDARDIIHDDRIAVEVDCPEDDWYRFMIESGLGTVSFAFQVVLGTDTGRIAKIMDEVKPGWRERGMNKRQENLVEKDVKKDRRAIFGEPPKGVKLTKQGIRDLDAVGPKQHLNKRQQVHDQDTCFHDFRISENQYDDPEYEGQKFSPHVGQCVKCGKSDDRATGVKK